MGLACLGINECWRRLLLLLEVLVIGVWFEGSGWDLQELLKERGC